LLIYETSSSSRTGTYVSYLSTDIFISYLLNPGNLFIEALIKIKIQLIQNKIQVKERFCAFCLMSLWNAYFSATFRVLKFITLFFLIKQSKLALQLFSDWKYFIKHVNRKLPHKHAKLALTF